MKNGIFTLELANFKSAIMQGAVAMVLGAGVAVAKYVYDAGTIFGLDWHLLIDKGAMAALGIFIAIVSLTTSALTTKKGNFLGAVKTVPDKKY